MLWFLAWYLAGVVGCVAGCYIDWKNGHDFTVKDLIKFVFFSLFGVIMLGIAVAHYLDQPRGNKVLIKGKNQ